MINLSKMGWDIERLWPGDKNEYRTMHEDAQKLEIFSLKVDLTNIS